MNKKVLSAILFSALFAGTGTFTSCIDNDEPAGIEELRGAKAELIRAKVAVEQAQASLLLAQAEVEKAKAAKQMADAEISKSLAAINQAKADSINAVTEKERAELEKTIAENKIHLDSMQVLGQIAMNKLNASLAESQRSYELMLAQIEIAKAVGSSANYVTISELQWAVRRAQFKVERAQEDVNEAQLEYNYYAAYDETHGELLAERFEAGITSAEEALADAKEALDKWENYLENAESADWIAEVSSLNDTLAVLKKDTNDLQIEKVKIQQSAEYIALKKASEEIAAAYVDSVYGYKYYDAYKGELKEFAKTLKGTKGADGKYTGATWVSTEKVDSLDAIKADLAASVTSIKEQKTADSLEVLSYTAYKKDLLDTIAAHAVDTMPNYNSNTTIKAWEAALAAYKAGQDVSVSSITTDATTFINAVKPANDGTKKTVVAKKAAVATFATKLAAVYNAISANQVVYTKFNLQDPSYPQTGTTTKEVTIASLLADATNQYHYLVYLLEEFGLADDVTWDAGTAVLDFELSTTGLTAGNYDNFFTKELSTTNTKSVLTSLKSMKKATLADNFTLDEDGNQIGTTLYGDLVVASANAFGNSLLYLNAVEDDVKDELLSDDNYYLTVKPDTADIHYVVNSIIEDNMFDGDGKYIEGVEGVQYPYGALGAYGISLTTKTTGVKAFAMNYKAYLANLEGAVAYWEKALEVLEKKAKDNAAAELAETQAFNAYQLANIQPLDDQIGVLRNRMNSINEIKTALLEGINAYLPQQFLDYAEKEGINLTLGEEEKLEDLKENYAEFIAFLETEVTDAKSDITTKEDELANAKMNQILYKENKHGVEIAQEALDKAIAKLEEKQAKLEEALANLAKGLEIIAAANGAEDAE